MEKTFLCNFLKLYYLPKKVWPHFLNSVSDRKKKIQWFLCNWKCVIIYKTTGNLNLALFLSLNPEKVTSNLWFSVSSPKWDKLTSAESAILKLLFCGVCYFINSTGYLRSLAFRHYINRIKALHSKNRHSNRMARDFFHYIMSRNNEIKTTLAS